MEVVFRKLECLIFSENSTNLFIIFNSSTREPKSNKNYKQILEPPSDNYKPSSEPKAALKPHLPVWHHTLFLFTYTSGWGAPWGASSPELCVPIHAHESKFTESDGVISQDSRHLRGRIRKEMCIASQNLRKFHA
jgi:hypothetical protein